MGYKQTPWAEAIFKSLEEHEPRTREELIQAGIGLVPPGRAYRRAEQNRIMIARTQGRTVRPRAVSDQSILTGARHVVAMSLAQFVRSGRLIKEGDSYRVGRAANYNIEKVRKWWANAPEEERQAAIRKRVEGKRLAKERRRATAERLGQVARADEASTDPAGS